MNDFTHRAIPQKKDPKLLYVFDLDGTIANLDHRLQYVTDGNKNWDAFYEACDMDIPNDWIIELMHKCDDGEVLILSGRSNRVRDKTQDWLSKHHVWYDALVMRKDGDHRPDELIKLEMLQKYLEENDHLSVEFIVDDRQRVVDMWRANGYKVLQCNAWKEQEKSKTH